MWMLPRIQSSSTFNYFNQLLRQWWWTTLRCSWFHDSHCKRAHGLQMFQLLVKYLKPYQLSIENFIGLETIIIIINESSFFCKLCKENCNSCKNYIVSISNNVVMRIELKDTTKHHYDTYQESIFQLNR